MAMLLLVNPREGWILDSWRDGSHTHFKLYGDITLEASVCSQQGIDDTEIIKYVEVFDIIVWCKQNGWADNFEPLPQ